MWSMILIEGKDDMRRKIADSDFLRIKSVYEYVVMLSRPKRNTWTQSNHTVNILRPLVNKLSIF